MTDAGEVRACAGAYTAAPALLGRPLPVRDASGRLASWFVPMVDGDRIVGFVELLPDLRHRRTSWFGGAPGSLDGCPPASWWLDPATILAHAAPELRPGETAGEPHLSFDGAPDRLAWAVPVAGPRGARTVYVAGGSAWSGAAATGLG